MNHQVLAVGYEEDIITKRTTLFLYDPNHPGQTPSITMDLSKPGTGIKIQQDTGESLRGFFVIDYERQDPPKFD